jgi:hypothetical protein
MLASQSLMYCIYSPQMPPSPVSLYPYRLPHSHLKVILAILASICTLL